jgi:hypothetical protein
MCDWLTIGVLRMKTTSSKLISLAVSALVGGGVLCGCRQKEHQTQNQATLHDLAIKYAATQDWEKALTNKTRVFTIDVQDALLNKSTAFEFTGTLEDVRRDGGHVVAHFTVPTAAGFSLSLSLTCTEDQRKILTHSWPDHYAIIADIQKVVKQGDLNVVVAARDESGEIEEQTFEVNWDTDTYWVTGTCRDLRALDKLAE